jgi:hypothetical protein
MDKVESYLRKCSEWGECSVYRSSDHEYMGVLSASNSFSENEEDIVTLVSAQGFSAQKNMMLCLSSSGIMLL